MTQKTRKIPMTWSPSPPETFKPITRWEWFADRLRRKLTIHTPGRQRPSWPVRCWHKVLDTLRIKQIDMHRIVTHNAVRDLEEEENRLFLKEIQEMVNDNRTRRGN